jgi:hypothetical protein
MSESFHGSIRAYQNFFDIDRKEAETILKDCPIGTYLIRPSATQGMYVISIRENTHISHSIIMHSGNKFGHNEFMLDPNGIGSNILETFVKENKKYDSIDRLIIAIEPEYLEKGIKLKGEKEYDLIIRNNKDFCNIDRKKAETILKDYPVGTYLIRPSSIKNKYVISIHTIYSGVEHLLINKYYNIIIYEPSWFVGHILEKFVNENNEYNSIDNLLNGIKQVYLANSIELKGIDYKEKQTGGLMRVYFQKIIFIICIIVIIILIYYIILVVNPFLIKNKPNKCYYIK